MTAEHRAAQIASERRKGDEALLAADTLFDIGLFNDAVARAYYAAFHYAAAALLSVDIPVRSHQGLHAMFSLHLVATGHITPGHAKQLKGLQGYRQAADYDSSFRFAADGAREEVAVARSFVADVKTFLER